MAPAWFRALSVSSLPRLLRGELSEVPGGEGGAVASALLLGIARSHAGGREQDAALASGGTAGGGAAVGAAARIASRSHYALLSEAWLREYWKVCERVKG